MAVRVYYNDVDFFFPAITLSQIINWHIDEFTLAQIKDVKVSQNFAP